MCNYLSFYMLPSNKGLGFQLGLGLSVQECQGKKALLRSGAAVFRALGV